MKIQPITKRSLLSLLGLLGLTLFASPAAAQVAAGPSDPSSFDTVIDLPVDVDFQQLINSLLLGCLLYTSPSPRDATLSRMPSSA